MRSRSLFFLLFTVLIIAFPGCSDKVKVRGKITFSDDQSPLTIGQVRFQSTTMQARGVLKSDGSYALGTVSEKDGIPKGTYTVAIVDAHDLIVPPSSGGALPMPVMKPLIAPFEETVVVDGKQKVFNFVVDRAE